MTEQLISFETAKLAKEKGFNEVCLDTYTSDGTLFDRYEIDFDDLKNKSLKELFEVVNSQCDNEFITAPTQSLLQKWLREIHNIHMVIHHSITDSFRTTVNNPMWRTGTEMKYIHGKIGKTYEEALESGLQEALKLIANLV